MYLDKSLEAVREKEVIENEVWHSFNLKSDKLYFLERGEMSGLANWREGGESSDIRTRALGVFSKKKMYERSTISFKT